MTTSVWTLQNKVPVESVPSAFACVNVFDKYAKRQQIGQGTYGEVWLAEDKETGEYVAIKKIKVDGQKEKRQGFPVTAIREIRVLQRLRHENLVHLKEVSRSNAFVSNGFKGSVYLAFEFAEHDLCGLHEKLRRNEPNEMPASLTKRFLRQLLSAVEYCHKQGVLHRDLKSSNVLITKKGQVKLADFGLARFLPPHEDLTYRVCTLWYRPPELLLGGTRYKGEVDIWSAGCIFFEMLTGRALFTGDKETSMLVSISQLLGPLDWGETTVEDKKYGFPHVHVAAEDLKHYHKLPKNVDHVALEEHFRRSCGDKAADDLALDLLTQMLSPDPAKRPNASWCLQHPYFTDPNSEKEMTEAEFLERTTNLEYSHEYSIKQRERKRGRREEDTAGVNNTPEAAPVAPAKLARVGDAQTEVS